MGQVPEKTKNYYGIYGFGRAAKSLKFYLQNLNQNVKIYSRRSNDSLEDLAQCTHLLLLVSDKDLASTAQILRQKFPDKTLIHCSAASDVAGVEKWHPLASFPEEALDFETLKNIHFVGSKKNRFSFEEVFPGLQNKNLLIPDEDFTYYHALCVLGGNFSSYLWRECFKGLKNLGLSDDGIKNYMQNNFQNLLRNPLADPSGPLTRKDQPTIEKHLDILSQKGTPREKMIYQHFVESFGS